MSLGFLVVVLAAFVLVALGVTLAIVLSLRRREPRGFEVRPGSGASEAESIE